jgi:tetratricopeptide (TPR) repeat protein
MTDSLQAPNEAVEWLRRGLRAVHAGDLDRARHCFQTACDADPENVVALLWLAWLAPSREESLALLVQVLEIDPRNERAHAGIRWARRRPSP